MKTNLPDGISQQNRTHPYFILLRNQNDEQQQLIRSVVHRFLTDAIRTAFISIIGGMLLQLLVVAVFRHMVSLRNYLAILVTISVVLSFHYIGSYRRLRGILSCQTNGRIEQMLYSNEFQSAILNHEEVLNLMMQCNRVSGMLIAFDEDIGRQSRAIVAVSMVLTIALAIL